MKGGPQTWDELRNRPVGVRVACISLDGSRIAAIFADNTLCIYDTRTGEVIPPSFKVDKISWSVVLSPDGNLVATSGQALRVWHVLTGEEVESFDIDVHCLAFSPDGTCIAAGCGRRDVKMDGRDGRDGCYNIRVINLELAKNSDPPHLFVSSEGESILLLKGEVWPSPFEGHGGLVSSLSYSADGKQIASCSDDWTIRVWDVSTGSRRTIRTTTSYNSSVAISPDGTRIASDGTLYNLSTGSDTPYRFVHSNDYVKSLSFSADGRFLAAGCSYIFPVPFLILDVSTHTSKTTQLVGHFGDIGSVAFLPDGKQIMSASEDGTIPSGKQQGCL